MSVERNTSETIPVGTSRLTREQQAEAELGTTRYSPGVRQLLTLMFVLTIVAVPFAEAVGDYRANMHTREEMRARGVEADKLPGRRPRVLDIVNVLPSGRQILSTRTATAAVDLLPKPSRLRAYEDALDLNSSVGRVIRPWVQWCLTAWLGTGSEKVLVGREGWLYYRDGVQYLTGPGFLDADQLTRRSRDGEKPDPRDAIIQFNDELAKMGIRLVVFPIPDKAMVQPESLADFSRTTLAGAQNPSWKAFDAALQQHGIPVLDVAGEMYSAETAGNTQFLRTDSHWSPAGADLAANILAKYLTDGLKMPIGDARYARQRIGFSRNGDLLTLLNLPTGLEHRVAPKEHLEAWQVITPAHERWQPDPSSDILVIGDSFLEMYSVEGEGVVPAAGLAEQLSFYLQRPVDRIASHEWGDYGARRALGDTLQGVRDRAKGRTIIVWEFAIRALATDSWTLLR